MGELKVDREARRRGFDRLRRELVIAESRLTPGERLARASDLVKLAPPARPDPPGRPRSRSR